MKIRTGADILGSILTLEEFLVHLTSRVTSDDIEQFV